MVEEVRYRGGEAMEYVVVIEKAGDGSYSAYLPDLPGCVARGYSR